MFVKSSADKSNAVTQHGGQILEVRLCVRLCWFFVLCICWITAGERESCVLTLDHAMQLYQFAKTLQDNFKLSDVTV